MTMDERLRVEEAKVVCARKVFDVIKEHAAIVYPEPAPSAYDAHEEDRQDFFEAVLEMLSE